jgi:hypothetical protein
MFRMNWCQAFKSDFFRAFLDRIERWHQPDCAFMSPVLSDKLCAAAAHLNRRKKMFE